MNRHLLYFTQRVASAAATSLVYAIVDRYTKQPKQKYARSNQNAFHSSGSYSSKQKPRYTSKPMTHARSQGSTGRRHQSMAEQMEHRNPRR